jgi:hypothetical protein
MLSKTIAVSLIASIIFCGVVAPTIGKQQEESWHWDCIIDGAKFVAPVAACIAAPETVITCVGAIAGAADFLNTCCKSFANESNTLADAFEGACDALGMGPDVILLK